MNIIEPGLKLIPNITKLIHCDGCDTTWPGKKIPAVCPYCGAGKSKVATAKDDACESFLNEYQEMLARSTEEESNDMDSPEESYGSSPSDEQAAPYAEDQTINDQATAYEDTYELIGYNPDEFMNNMMANAKAKKEEIRAMLQDAEQRVKETKWALQRAGLPTDAIETNSVSTIAPLLLDAFDRKTDHRLLYRRLGVCADNVKPDPKYYQLNMFIDYEALAREKRLQGALTEIRSRFGRNAVFKGNNLLKGATQLERNQQIGGHRA